MNTQPLQETKKPRVPILFAGLIVLLVIVFVYGLRWVFSLGRGEIGSVPFLLFDYAVGLTMIFLPCTLPLAFVIVPLVMGQSYRKGFGMAIAFGVGVAFTLSLYGALIGFFGQALGINRIETAKNILYAVAGFFAILFALGELGLIRFHAPTYSGAVPQFILKQKDLFRAGLMGLFLGNVGVGCPNPLFNAVIIPQIIAGANAFEGWIIMFVQALGRITPLFILAFLAILGINATKFLVRHKDAVANLTAWTSIFIGGFLLTLGLFGHDWWVLSGMHTLVEFLTQENFITNALGGKIGELGHAHGAEELVKTGLFGLPINWGTPFLLFVWIFSMLWYWRKKKNTVVPVGGVLKLASLLLIVVFGYYLPHMFAAHWSTMGEERRGAATQDFHVTFSTSPALPKAGEPFYLSLTLHDEEGNPVTDLKVSHEKILHVILVSEDLEEFLHAHPEEDDLIYRKTQENEFQISLNLLKGGRYRVLIDAFRRDKGEVFDLAWLVLQGDPKAISIVKDVRRDRAFGEYRVVFNVNPEEVKFGEEAHLSYYIEKDGYPVFNTEPYLGADMHVVIAPVDLSTLIHTHGTKVKFGPTEGHKFFPIAKAHGIKDSAKEQGIASGEIELDYVFLHPGLWKIYGQFQHQGKVITTEFMLEVAPGVQTKMAPHSAMPEDMHEDGK